MTLGKRLKLLRLEKGLSLKEFADIFGLGKTTVANYERNDRKPDYEIISKFCDFFDVSSDYLLGRTDNPKVAILKGDDLPKEMREVGIEEVAVLKEFREAGLSPEDVKEIIEWYKWKKEKGKS